jgi:gas vesicle protein
MGQGEQREQRREPAEGAGVSGTASFVAGVVVGALIGAGIALLVAPTKGSALRRRLGRRARALGARARDGLEEAAHQTRRDLARRRRGLQERLDDLADETRDSLSDLP